MGRTPALDMGSGTWCSTSVSAASSSDLLGVEQEGQAPARSGMPSRGLSHQVAGGPRVTAATSTLVAGILAMLGNPSEWGPRSDPRKFLGELLGNSFP